MKDKMTILVSCCVALASLGGLAAAGEAPQGLTPLADEPYDRTSATGFFMESAELFRLELRGREPRAGAPSHELQLRIVPLDPSGTEALRVLWTGNVLAPAWRGGLSFARAGGSEHVAGTMDGGATRAIALWSSGAHDAPSAARFDAVRTLRWTREGAAGELETLLARDLHDPLLVEHGDALHVVASASRSLAPDCPWQDFVWIARLDPDPETEHFLWERGVDGRFLAEGVDPRVARLADGFLVAVRKPANPLERKGEAPLCFYRSADLASWTLDEALSSDVEVRGDYAIAYDGGSIRVATTTGEDGSLLSVRRFDAAGGGWKEEAQRSIAPAPPGLVRGRCWLVPRPASSGLELLHLDPSGDLVRMLL